ncbi:DUF6477 family protein [Rhodobacter sp. Har01]|uniref:DUF6477 family protein n=1 Tax=Rhodobacter sp. Har01 TaxID=2883999 RepID=UPI001D05EAF0|nr:DUF6477 family protein [Rhodobacter sp. Har01]MCB6177200.1 DUF6477 family protein [Rhodobacter sp. Har01]
MPESHPALSQLRRPGLMMRAARFGLVHYRRGRQLQRLLAGEMRPERTVPRLFEAEAAFEETRRRGDAAYSVVAHLEVLVALLAECRLLTAARGS